MRKSEENRLTCPALVMTDLYQRHFTLNLLSVWPSWGTSSAEINNPGDENEMSEWRLKGGILPVKKIAFHHKAIM